MLYKSCDVKVKAAGPDDSLGDGQFEAIVSVFGNMDSYGDVVMPGAFTKTLNEWQAKGDPIPVYYSHQMSDPFSCIGEVLEAKETEQGLYVKAQLDIDDPVPGSKALQVYRLLKGRRVTQFSFAYDILDADWAERTAKGDNGDELSYEVYELKELKLHEVGPTPIGANQETELLAVKSAGDHAKRLAAEVKAGRVLSSKNENILREAAASLKSASSSITDVLTQLDDESKSGESESKDEKARSGGPEETPIHRDPARSSALLEILTAS